MKDSTTTAQSVRAAVAYFILQDVWTHLLGTGARSALDLIESLTREHMKELDQASYLAVRGLWSWHMGTLDLAAWGEDLDNELPEASCEGCGERLSLCQCDGGWNQARRDEDAGRIAMGNCEEQS